MMEDREKPFLAVDDVLGSGKSAASKQRALGAHSPCPWINRVLHVGQLAGRHSARTKCARRTDADGGHHLIGSEIQKSARCDRSREGAQGGVMPTVFARPWPPDFAKTHFNFV